MKSRPDPTAFDASTLRHSRVVLFEWYEFLLERGSRPLLNPIPASQRRMPGRGSEVGGSFGRYRPGRRSRVDPPKPETMARHLSDEHFEALWAGLNCDRDRALVKIAVDSGVRPAELLGLCGESIDWGNATVHVLRKGGRRAQWVPVSAEAIGWLRRYQYEAGYVAGAGEPVWVTRRQPRRRLTYDAYRAVFTRANVGLGTDWTPHDLRHTACVRMLDAGMDLYKVSEIMGHVHLATTQKYLRPRLDELIEAQHAARQLPEPSVSPANDYDAADLRALFGPA